MKGVIEVTFDVIPKQTLDTILIETIDIESLSRDEPMMKHLIIDVECVKMTTVFLKNELWNIMTVIHSEV